jgi:pimeloyl-ACP methyl ester carboxylesterase
MRISVEDVNLWFDVDGACLVVDENIMVERRTIVVLHGGPGFDHSYLKPELQALAEHAQIVFLDQRGQGRSDHGNPDEWSLDRWADDVAMFCQALGIVKPILLGHSFGGFVALATAARHPDLASGLVILASAAYVQRETVIARFGELGGTEAADAARVMFARPGDEAAFAGFAQFCFPLYAKDPAKMMAKLGLSQQRPEVQAHFFRPDGEFGRFDYRAGLRGCHAPTLMLHGALDPIVPVAFAVETASSFPPGVAQLTVYEDSAHDLIGDRWSEVHASIVSFIESLH